MHGDRPFKQFSPYRPEGLERSALVRPDQPRIAGDIGGETAGRGYGWEVTQFEEIECR